MAIGTSRGAYFDDEFHHAAGINTDPSIDNNVIDPDVDPEGVKPKPAPTIIPQPVADIKVSGGRVITEEDIDKAISLGMSFSGGGLATKEAEVVKSAALKYKGQVTEGVNHGEALDKLLEQHKDFSWKTVEDGFTTNHGRFLSREDAFKLANERKQIDTSVANSVPEGEHGMLLSEDLLHTYNHDAHVEYMNGE